MRLTEDGGGGDGVGKAAGLDVTADGGIDGSLTSVEGIGGGDAAIGLLVFSSSFGALLSVGRL